MNYSSGIFVFLRGTQIVFPNFDPPNIKSLIVNTIHNLVTYHLNSGIL